MVMTRVQQESTKIDNVLGFLGIHEAAAEVLGSNHISDIMLSHQYKEINI